MANETRRLGRGLEALLSHRPANASTRRSGAVVSVEALVPGSFQPRESFPPETLAELADSIKTQGVLQPITVRLVPRSHPPQYEIVAGERRWRAAKVAGLTEVPVTIRDYSDQEALAVGLIENIQRENLSPVEEARALKRLIEEFALTHEQVAHAVSRSRAAVSNLLRLLLLPTAVLDMVASTALSMGHARALLSLPNESERTRIAHIAVSKGLSVRETEIWVRNAGVGVDGPPASTSRSGAVAREIRRARTMRISLQEKGRVGGRIIVDVSDAHTRDAVLEALKAVADDCDA